MPGGGDAFGSFGTGPDGCFNGDVRRMREFCESRSTLSTGKRCRMQKQRVLLPQILTRLWLPRPAASWEYCFLSIAWWGFPGVEFVESPTGS